MPNNNIKQEIKELREKILNEIDKKDNDYSLNLVEDVINYIHNLEYEYEEIFRNEKLLNEFNKIYFDKGDGDYGDNYENIEVDAAIEFLQDAIKNIINDEGLK